MFDSLKEDTVTSGEGAPLMVTDQKKDYKIIIIIIDNNNKMIITIIIIIMHAYREKSKF